MAIVSSLDFRVAMEEHDEITTPVSLRTVMMDFAVWIGVREMRRAASRAKLRAAARFPMLLRRLDCVLESTKDALLAFISQHPFEG